MGSYTIQCPLRANRKHSYVCLDLEMKENFLSPPEEHTQ